MAAGTSGSKPSALPVLVLGAGAAFGAFKLAMALTTSDTAQTQLWGGITGAVLLAILLVARRRGAEVSSGSSRAERRAEARVARDAAKAEKTEAAAAAKVAKAEAKAEAKAAKAEAKRGGGDEGSPSVSKREAKAAAEADAKSEAARAQEEAKRRGGVAVAAPRPAPESVPGGTSAPADRALPAVAPESRPAVFSDLTSPDAVGAEQVAGLAQRALAAVSEQLAALDERPLDAALITELRRLAARVRRNGDALIVLAGGAPAPVRSGPTDLTVAVGEAVASLDGADRVRVRPLDPAWVDAPVAAAIADVVAELVENALRGSEAPEPVEVFGRSERGGYALAVVDRGPGLAPEARAHVNARLAGLTESPAGGGIGFEVIARLAAAHDLRVELAPARGGGCAALVGVPVHRVIETRAIGKPEPTPIPVPPGVEVASESVAPVIAADVLGDQPVEAIPTSPPEDDVVGWRSGSSVPRVEPTPAADLPPSVVPPLPSSPAAGSSPPAAETTPRPNLGLGSFADLHAASPAAPPVPPAAPPVAANSPVEPTAPPTTEVPLARTGSESPPTATADPSSGADPTRWVVPDVSADLLPGRTGKRGRGFGPRGEGAGVESPGGPAVSWGEAHEGETSEEEATRAGQQSEERSDYFDAFRAAADRAREHAGFDEN